MNLDLAQKRQEAHLLIDALPAEKLNAVRDLLSVMVEPLAASLALAPADDEELNADTIASIERARASLAAGKGISHEEVMRDFGL